MPGDQQAIPITSLGPQELKNVRDKVELDAQRLQTSRLQLQRVVTAFSASQNAIETLKKAENGQEILLPLSGSLYISGQLSSVDNVLVDIGTGYFAERSVDEGIDYCKRKVEKLKGKIAEYGEALMEKQNVLGHITQVLQTKMQAMQANQTPS